MCRVGGRGSVECALLTACLVASKISAMACSGTGFARKQKKTRDIDGLVTRPPIFRKHCTRFRSVATVTQIASSSIVHS